MAMDSRVDRLSVSTLRRVPQDILVPGYRREAVSIGVVHLGLGNFHRAHQAVYFEKLLNLGDLRWGISAVSLKRAVTRDALQAQDFLYSVLTRSAHPTEVQVIGAIKECLVAPENPAAVIERLAHVNTKIISLTVTEKGYLEKGDASALGYLLKALELRRQLQRPVTILCCDNLSSNGERLHRQLVQEAQLTRPLLSQWIVQCVACPDTMVDRIVPATLYSERDEARSRLGLVDAWPVAAEPFSQWVIEKRFAAEVPDFESVGVQVVASCAPYEAMKLRLLNAAHSALAYFGAPAGFKTVDQVLASPLIQAYLRRLWSEAAATLPGAQQKEVASYVAALETRFANPALAHRLAQIAMDGSLKVPVRLLATLRDCCARDLPSDAIELALAAWIRWLGGVDEAGQPYELVDPMRDELLRLVPATASRREKVQALLQFQPVFGSDLSLNESLAERLVSGLERLDRLGSLRALAHLAA